MAFSKNLPVRVFTSNDVGAPAATAYPSSWITIIKKCLIEGYGATTPVGGWTLAFEDVGTIKAVFRNSTVDGSGGYVQFGSATNTDTLNGSIYVETASSMSGVDLFTHKGLRRTIRALSSAPRWILVATTRGFYFQSLGTRTDNNPSGANHQCWFVGDIDSFYENDAGCFTMVMHSTQYEDATSSANESLTNYIKSHLFNVLYDLDGNDFRLEYYLKFYESYYTSTLSMGAPEVDGHDVSFYECLICGTFPTAIDRFGVPIIKSITSPMIRGKLAGHKVASHNGYFSSPWPTIRTINGIDHIGMVNEIGVQTWINTVTWYE
jgi:hypothetical protein